MAFIGSYWRGEKPLWKSFWLTALYGILLMTIPGLIYVNIFADHNKSSDTEVLSWIGYIFIVYYIVLAWWAVAVWRSSRISKQFWKVLARVVVILAVLNNVIGLYDFISKYGIDCLADIKCLEKIKEENGN